MSDCEELTPACLKKDLDAFYASADIDVAKIREAAQKFMAKTPDTKAAAEKAQKKAEADNAKWINAMDFVMDRGKMNKANTPSQSDIIGERVPGEGMRGNQRNKLRRIQEKIQSKFYDHNPNPSTLTAMASDVRKVFDAELASHKGRSPLVDNLIAVIENSGVENPPELWVIRAMIKPFEFSSPPDRSATDPRASSLDHSKITNMPVFYGLSSRARKRPKSGDIISVAFPNPEDRSWGQYLGIVSNQDIGSRPIKPKNAFSGGAGSSSNMGNYNQ